MLPGHHGHNCCTGHGHELEEMDPCMAQEIAQIERNRIMYDRLKSQSDALLMNLNIRTNKLRVRGAVSQNEEEEACSSCDERVVPTESKLVTRKLSIAPNQFSNSMSQYKDSKLFVLCVPCDVSIEYTPEILKQLSTVFDTVSPGVGEQNSSFILCRLSTKLCVCGRCPEPDSRPVGTLRSVAMILKGSPTVVLTRNGGLVGVWSYPKDGDPTKSLQAFISKHI